VIFSHLKIGVDLTPKTFCISIPYTVNNVQRGIGVINQLLSQIFREMLNVFISSLHIWSGNYGPENIEYQAAQL
jgi:hypothetical protein